MTSLNFRFEIKLMNAICPCPVTDQPYQEILTKYPILPIDTIFLKGCTYYQVIKLIDNRKYKDLRGLWETPISKQQLLKNKDYYEQTLEQKELDILYSYLSQLNRGETYIFPTFERLTFTFLMYLFLANNCIKWLNSLWVEMPHLEESTWVKGEKWEKTYKYQSYLIQPLKQTRNGLVANGKPIEWTQRGQVFLSNLQK